MLLKSLIKKIPHKEVIGNNLNCSIEQAGSDSRLLFDNSIFLVRRGNNFNALDFVFKVKDKVNCFIVSASDKLRVLQISKKMPKKVFILVDDIDKTSSKLADILFRDVKKLNLIGVTGTNGKTTVASLVNKVLNDLGKKSGLLGTISYRWADKDFSSFLTTLDNFMLRSLLQRMYKDKIRYVVLEVSSHGLAQNRIAGLRLSRAIFTNLSRDHLDFHKNLENYFKTKCKIFNYLDNRGLAIINVDDKRGFGHYAKIRKPKLSYAIKKEASYKARAYRFGGGRLEFLIRLRKKDYFVTASLSGVFNIYNVLASLACCDSLGLNLNKVTKSISLFKPPQGRLEKVKQGIFVDYAHTPDALSQAISTLRDARFKKIILVFGCGGDRDKSKRPLMGRIASLGADYSIITSDNPRSENPYTICRQIQKGAPKRNQEIILDRKKAIIRAIRLKKNNTAVLIAGKGHENYQIFKNKTLKFSDKKIVNSLIK